MEKENVKALFEKAAGTEENAIIMKPGVEGIAILFEIEDISIVATAFAAQDWNADHSFTFTDFQILHQLLVDAEDEFETVDDIDKSLEIEDIDHSLVEQGMTLIDKTEHVELESYVAHRKQLYFQSNPGEEGKPQAVLEAEWARSFHYAEIRKFLFQKTFDRHKIAHKMMEGIFIPLISPASLADEQLRSEATSIVQQITANHLEPVEKKFWTEWEKQHAYSQFLDEEPFVFFEQYATENYFRCLKEAQKVFIPRVSVETKADEQEIQHRRKLLTIATSDDGAAAEKHVEAQWQLFKERLETTAVTTFPSLPTEKYWKEHYWPALKQVLKGASAIDKGRMENMQQTSEQTAKSNEMAEACIADMMGGGGYEIEEETLEELEFLGSRAIHEHTSIGTKCMYEGRLMHFDDSARSLKKQDSGTSPKRGRTNTAIVDMLLLDQTGPMLFCFSGNEEVEVFLTKAKKAFGDNIRPIISLSVVRVGDFAKNDWNGPSLTKCYMLYSLPSKGKSEGTRVDFIEKPRSPYLVNLKFAVPSPSVCISSFDSVRAFVKPPFRGTFRGWVWDLQPLDVTQQGTSKRVFKLMDY